jgi:hypothetical protein
MKSPAIRKFHYRRRQHAHRLRWQDSFGDLGAGIAPVYFGDFGFDRFAP